MATVEELQYLIRVNDRDLKELKQNLDTTNKALDEDVGRATGNADQHLQRFGGAAKIASGVLLGGLAVGANQAIKAAADLGEQVNKTKAVFGPAATEVLAFSKTSATAIGASRVQALEMAGTFGNMLVPMGIAREKAAELGTGLLKAGADMASFNNASIDETLGAIQSGLAGETEPLRKFGVFLNADRVAAEALALGFGKTEKGSIKAREALLRQEMAAAKLRDVTKEHGKTSLEARRAALELEKANEAVKKAGEGSASGLSAASKAQATYSLIMKDMQKSGAIGDFVKTSDGLANSQRIQAAQAEDLKVSMGEGLLPAYQTLRGVLGSLIGVMTEHQGVTKIAILVAAGLAAGVLLVSAAMKVYTAGQAVATAGAALFGKTGLITSAATKAWAAAQWLLNAALTANPIGLVILAIAALGAALILAYKRSETFRNIVKAALDTVRGAAQAVATFVTEKIPAAFSTVVSWVRRNWPIIATLISGPFAPLVALATNAFGIRSAMVGALDAVKTKASDVVGAVVGFFTGLGGRLTKPLELARAAFTPWRLALDLIGDGLGKVKDVIGWLTNNADNLAKKLGPLTSVLGKVGGVLGHVPGLGDVAEGFNAVAAKAQRAQYAAMSGATGQGLAPQTAGLLATINSLFGGVVLTSGRRSPEENRRVGGAPNSDHLTGRALDLVPAGGWSASGIALLDQIAGWAAGLPGVRWIGWRGVAGHGPGDHLHISTYDQGGWLPPGVSLAINNTGRPERIVAPGQTGDAGPLVYIENYHASRAELDAQLIGSAVSRALAVR